MNRLQHQYTFTLFLPLVIGIISGIITNFLWREPALTIKVCIVVFFVFFIIFYILRQNSEKRILGKLKVYANYEKAKKDILKSGINSSFLNIIAIRGVHIFESEVYSEISKQLMHTNTKVRILLQCSDSQSLKYYLNQTVPQAQIKDYLTKLGSIVNSLLKQKEFGADVTVGCYSEPPLWKLIITNRHCFFIGYTENKRGHSLPLIRVENTNNCFAVSLSRYFDELWEKSKFLPK
jgi:hypothetical protein